LVLKTKFDVNDGIHRHYILGKIGKRWRDNRSDAFNSCYDPSLSWEVNVKRHPKGIDEDKWAAFLTHRLKPEEQVKIYRLRKMSSITQHLLYNIYTI
jgi:hypothetical protein